MINMARRKKIIDPNGEAPNPFGADEMTVEDGAATEPVETEQVPGLADWIAEASEKAGTTIKQNAEMGYGTVLPAHPDLRYSVADGELPPQHLSRWRAELESLGYREVTADVSVVIGVAKPVVYAIPKEVYRKVIRVERLRRQRELNDRWDIREPHVSRPASVS